MLKKTASILGISALLFSLSVSSYAAAEGEDNVTTGTWSRGEVTQDPIPPFSGTITDSAGNTTPLTVSPFTGSNIITHEQAISSGNHMIRPNDYWDSNNTHFYEYVDGSYSQTIHIDDQYHFQVGHTQSYNATTLPSTLAYTQQTSVTTQWAVTAQISVTPKLKAKFLQELGVTLGGSYTDTHTTSSSTTILNSISIAPGKTGYINAWLPGGYSYGTAKYKEYLYNSFTGTFTATGNTVTTNQGGWAPTADTSLNVLNFTTGYL